MKSTETPPDFHNKIRLRLNDREWRLNNLYFIKDTAGKKIKFRMNWAQNALFKNLWFFNCILKARQLGFTTFILIYFLDACLFNSNHSAGVVAHTREVAEDIFNNKVKFAYDSLPAWIKAENSTNQDSARTLSFENGSSITVGTSLRSGTYQKLLVSEYGKMAARYPEKAIEIKTGAFNTVHAGQQIFVESTAEGKSGEFYELCEISKKLQQEQRHLTPLDPRFHFFAWFNNPDYTLSDSDLSHVSITSSLSEYFEKVEAQTGIKLLPGQKAWYVKKESVQGDLMKREFPSTPDEAFESSTEGAFYAKEMAMVRRQKQICRLPYERSKPVDTFWDIGLNDLMTVWFFQHIGHEYRFINYYESNNEGWEHYANMLKATGYVFGTHYWPHDGNKRIIGAQVITSKQMAEGLGIRPITIVPRTNDVLSDIRNYCKPVLPRCFFDEVNCAKGIAHLDNYRKKWDETNAIWSETPLHDASSHGADGFRTFAVGYKGRTQEFIDQSDRQQFAEY